MLNITDQEAFVEWLLAKLRERGWSYSELGRRGGFSHSAISHIVNDGASPGHKLIKGIAKAFDMPVAEVMRQAGQLPLPSGEENEAELLALFRQLPEDEQERILLMARTLYKHAQSN